MTMAAPSCTACGGVFACTNCERTLRKQFSAMHEVDHLMMNAGETSGVHRFFDAAKAQALYASRFPIGERGGAMIDFGRAVVVECYLPFKLPSGLELPYVPLPLNGEIVHDIGRKKDIALWELEACKSGYCRCKSRPTGWRLTRPIVRALLNVTDSFINDHGRLLPGALGAWELEWHTVTFMRDCFFNPNFVLPKREESREARAERARSRSTAWKHTHPEHARRRRR